MPSEETQVEEEGVVGQRLRLGLTVRALVVVQPILLTVSSTESVELEELEERQRPLRMGLPACWQG